MAIICQFTYRWKLRLLTYRNVILLRSFCITHHKFAFRKNYNDELIKFNEKETDFTGLDPDKFGNFAEKYNRTRMKYRLKAENEPDDEDGYDKIEIKRGVKKSIDAYIRILNELRREKPPNVAKMLELHRQFVYEDRYIPHHQLYDTLISVCADVGFTQKAIELYKEMKMFKLEPRKPVVTMLINACANCTHTPQYGLEQVAKLRDDLEMNGYQFNGLQYNVLIKAYARLGQMETAVSTLEEMKTKKCSIKPETYSMLLMGYINDKNRGLFGATNLFSKVVSVSRLDVHLVNLFLRCVRECQITPKHLLQLCSGQSSNKETEKTKSDNIVESSLPRVQETGNQVILPIATSPPNILTGDNINQIVSIDHSSLIYAENRFLLFGGVQGFTQMMDTHLVRPNLKTITLFIDLMDLKNIVEESRNLLKRYGLKADIYLYNVLIKRLAKKGKYNQCQEVIRSMQSDSIQPDIMTFGALTFTCNEIKYAKRLLNQMAEFGIVANDKILGSLINIACSQRNLEYVLFLLEYIQKEKLSLSKIDVEQIDLLLKHFHAEISNNERRNLPVEKKIKELYEQVQFKFKSMIKNTNIVTDSHPWTQFRSSPIVSKKAKLNSFVSYMERKKDIKLRKEKPTVHDYNDEIDP
ncbi:Pentatricopeptide repeat-containing protein 1, mitochondrial [Blomia tropicalis]|nr:Pentatricopeptide repeat-containing protein 1, mitochondrial [Blomia tropicalis]